MVFRKLFPDDFSEGIMSCPADAISRALEASGQELEQDYRRLFDECASIKSDGSTASNSQTSQNSQVANTMVELHPSVQGMFDAAAVFRLQSCKKGYGETLVEIKRRIEKKSEEFKQVL